MHAALIKEFTIRRVEHRSETHSSESHHLAEGTEVARLRRRFSFHLQQALSFRTRHHLCRQGVALGSTRQLRSQGPVSVHAHRTEGVTGSEGREGANGIGGGIGVGGGIGEGNGDGGGDGGVNCNGDWDGAGAGAGAGTRVETRGRTQDGNRDGSGDGNASSSRDGDGGADGNSNEDGIGESGGEAKMRKKPYKNCRRDQALSFRKRHHLCSQGVALVGTRQLRSQGPVPVNAHRTKGVTGSEGREGANEVGVEIGVGGENGDGNGLGVGGRNGDENDNGDGDGTGTGTGTGWKPVGEHSM